MQTNSMQTSSKQMNSNSKNITYLQGVTTFLCIVLSTCVINSATAAKFYKWTDEDGNTHYSDQVPEGVATPESVRINAKAPKDSEASQAELEKRRKQWFTDADNKTKSADELAKDAEIQKATDDFCKGVNDNIKLLERGGRITTLDEKGDSRYLGDDEIKKKLSDYRSRSKDKCGA